MSNSSDRSAASPLPLAVDDVEMRRLVSAFSSAWADFEAARGKAIAPSRARALGVVEQLSCLRAGNIDALLDQAAALDYFYAHHGDDPTVLADDDRETGVTPEVRLLRALILGLYGLVRDRDVGAPASAPPRNADRRVAMLHTLYRRVCAAEAEARAAEVTDDDNEDLTLRISRCANAVAREMADIRADTLTGILCQVDVLRSIYADDGPEPDFALAEDASAEGVVTCAVIRGLLALPFDPVALSPTSEARASAV